MNTRRVTVSDRDGHIVPADLIVCPECEGERFIVFVLLGQHLHFQCLDCECSFCDGTCSAVGTTKTT